MALSVTSLASSPCLSPKGILQDHDFGDDILFKQNTQPSIVTNMGSIIRNSVLKFCSIVTCVLYVTKLYLRVKFTLTTIFCIYNNTTHATTYNNITVNSTKI